MKVLELYSGIGGMHLALEASGIPGEILASIDINTVANSVYQHNFPNTNLLNRNIQSITPKYINKLRVDTILMSPPCQPFTRNGLQKDVEDARTCSFTHILEILPQTNVENILIENVKGFEISEMRERLILALNGAGFKYQEYILTPSQVGVPNTRHRYYCLASKKENFAGGLKLLEELPNSLGPFEEPFEISKVLEERPDIADFYLSEKLLSKRANILDICYSNSKRSCCFTKAYGRYIEGTGSVFTEKTKEDVQKAYEDLGNVEGLLGLKLRFFTPIEVCRLMAFPESFSFPESTSKKQQYNLLGNSINVKVVSELIKLLNT